MRLPSSFFQSRRLVLAMGLAISGAAGAEPPAPASANSHDTASADIYFYPKRQQNGEQQDRDRYECYLWAHRETGVDPSSARPRTQRMARVVAVPGPGHDMAAGAVVGAVIGASVSRPRDAGAGAAIGAVAGAVLGGASDRSRQQAADRAQANIDRERAEQQAKEKEEIDKYRRALKACLEGRGYSVE
jgi:hypothetical protein